MDVAKAAVVTEKINAIGEVNYPTSATTIEEARAAYDALTDDQKALVKEDKLAALEKAEKDYEALIENNKLRITYRSAEKITTDKIEDLVIVANGDLDRLVEILINGKTLNPENYTLASGSTILTLKKSYLASLEPGKYDVTFVYNDGRTANSEFEIERPKAEGGNPITGDNITLWISLLLVSMVGIVGTKKLTGKKKRVSKH